MKKMIAALGAALLAATPVAAETIGEYEVGVVNPGAGCAMATKTGSMMMMITLDAETKSFSLTVADPRLPTTDGGHYPFTLTLDDSVFNGTALGVNREGVHAVALFYTDVRSFYESFRAAEKITLNVGGADLFTLQTGADFDTALDAVVACTANELRRPKRIA